MDIYVGNLAYKSTDEDLRGLFAQYGEVTSARVVTDRATGRSKGFGFVEMPNAEEAQKANPNCRATVQSFYNDNVWYLIVYKSYNDNNRIAVVLEDVIYNLRKHVSIAFHHSDEFKDATDETLSCGARCITNQFFKQIPKIREFLATDVEALFDGDPAAESADEIIFAYPGLYAVTVFRFAHELYKLNVPVIPRIMTELAHSKTGIDINPGATIGKYFMIDHGTGIVIGETTEIGEHVKIYQGVTLGALSTSGGRKLFNKKRHPTIEDNVTIYSGASILGGDTVIGKGSLIGGNVFLTHSVPPETRVSVKNQELRYNMGSCDL